MDRTDSIFRKLTKIQHRLYAWGLDNLFRLQNYPEELAVFEKHQLFVDEICAKTPLRDVSKKQMEALNAIWQIYNLENHSANGNSKAK